MVASKLHIVSDLKEGIVKMSQNPNLFLTMIYSKCDLASDLWQQPELASKLESDPQDTVDWGRKCLVNFNAGKTQLVSFDQSYTSLYVMKIIF